MQHACYYGGASVVLALFLEVPVALAVGLAVLWLLAPYLDCRHRFRAFLGNLTVLVIFTVFSFAARVGWGLGVEPIASLLDPRHCAATANAGVMGLPFVVPLVLPIPGLAAAIVLCGLACQGRHRPFGLYPRFFVSLLAVSVGMSALLYVFRRIAWPGGTEFAPFIPAGLIMAVVTFAILLPFLILSSASPFFGERLNVLLHLKPEAPPAIEARRAERDHRVHYPSAELDVADGRAQVPLARTRPNMRVANPGETERGIFGLTRQRQKAKP